MTNKQAEGELYMIIFAVIAVGAFLVFLYNLIINNPKISIFIAASIIGFIVFMYRLSKQKQKPVSKQKQKPVSKQKQRGYRPVSYVLPHQWNTKLISDLEWKCFESLCSLYFTEKGYQAKLTRKGADGGVDIELFKNKTLRAIVQCKRWNVYKVGVKPIRELLGVMHDRDGAIPKGIFITSGDFTSEALDLADRKNIQLISGDELLARIKVLPQNIQDNLLSTVTTGDYKTPSCPSCDIKMISRKGRKNKFVFWGCKNYPKCRQTFKKNHLTK